MFTLSFVHGYVNERLPREVKKMAKVKTAFEIAMQAKGITGAEISRALGVGEAIVSHWKQGRMYIPPKYHSKLAELLGVRIDELVDERVCRNWLNSLL